MYVAIRIWHWFLRKLLSSKDRLASAVPTDQSETVEILSNYSKKLQAAMNDLVTAMGIDGFDGEPLKEAAGQGLQIFLSGHTSSSFDQRERPVKYRYLAGLHDSDARVVCKSEDDSGVWTGHGRVDSFLNDAPSVAACKELKGDINKLVGRDWL